MQSILNWLVIDRRVDYTETCTLLGSPVGLVGAQMEVKTPLSCIEYRRLNRITLPKFRTNDMYARTNKKFGKCKYFSKLDLSKGYWQIPVAEEDDYKTAFGTPDGCYKCLRMPFGMMNSGATLV